MKWLTRPGKIRKWVSTLALFLLCSATAIAQNKPAYYTGTLTPGHAAKWVAPGVLADAGGAGGSSVLNGGYLTELGITNTGTPFCISDALTSASGGYRQLCFGANSLSAGALISYTNYGGATALPLTFNINGTSYAFPYTVGGIVGPGTSVIGDLACWNNTGGSLLKDCPSAGVPANVLNTQTSNYTVATSDCGKTIQAGTGSTGLFTVTLPAVSGFATNCTVLVKNGDTVRGKILSGFPSDLATVLYPLQSVSVSIINGAWLSTYNPGRWRLLSSLNLYGDVVNGVDTNDCLASGSGNACKTIQHLIDLIIQNLDLSEQAVTVSLACGTYPESLFVGNFVGFKSSFGYSQVVIQGCDTTPTTILAPTSNLDGIFATGNNPPWVLKNIKLQSAGSGNLVHVDSGGVIALDGVQFGATTSPGAHMLAQFAGSRIAIINNNYSIAGGASIHEDAQYGAVILHQTGHVATLTGTPVFAVFARVIGSGTVFTNGTTYTGAASGGTQQYQSIGMGDIETGGVTLPGGTAGQVYSGGTYNINTAQNLGGVALHPVALNVGVPALSSCGSSPGVGGADSSGQVTTGGGASACTITFVTAWVSTPSCIVQRLNTSSSLVYSVSNTAITISTASAGASYVWKCEGVPGG